MPTGDGRLGLAGIRVAADVVEARPQRGVEPLRPRPVVHVDREVDQPLLELRVPVVAQAVGERLGLLGLALMGRRCLRDRTSSRRLDPTGAGGAPRLIVWLTRLWMSGSNPWSAGPCTAAAKRRAISGWPAQCVCR